MKVYEAIIKRRSIRRFEDKVIPYKILKKCVNSARLAPSGGNLQPLEYIIVREKSLLEKVFETLKWARYLKGEEGTPPEGERPKAYIAVLVNEDIRKDKAEKDVGFAAENIILTAFEQGVGSCCIGSIDKGKLREILSIPKNYEISLVIALGYSKEKPKVEKFSHSIKYWKDSKGVLHVPKRNLEEILHKNQF
jgi:nitroreductase